MSSEKIVMTLLVRNEADIVRDVLTYHLKNGVDHIVVTDNGSEDGTVEIIEEFVGAGVVDLFHEPTQDYAQSEWVTRMALFARDCRAADWIINSDADEFWYHPSGSLKGAVRSRSERILKLFRRNMLPVLEQDVPTGFESSPAQVMTMAVVSPVGGGSPADMDRYLLWQLSPKIICSAHGLRSVAQGNHDAEFDAEKTVFDLSDTLIYHYPIRNFAQFETKVIHGGASLARNARLPIGSGFHWREWYKMYISGDLRAAYDRMVLSPSTRFKLSEAGILCEDRTMADLIGPQRAYRAGE
jgi:hypothetical protein